MLLGIDTGGTFTDFVCYDGDDLRIHKVLSTPHAPEQAILQGIREMGLAGRGCDVVHGSTVATNAILEGKGARTVFITNRGFRDLLTIGRQARSELYNLQPAPQPPPVPRELCLETGGRLGADGTTVEALTEQDLARLRESLHELAPQAVAINLLFSFLDDRFERAVEAVIPEHVFVSRSSAVLPEYREYERAVTTWLNACVGPLMEGYLARLAQALGPSTVTVMQGSGGTVAAACAGDQAVHLLLSGPAGGLAGARFVASSSGYQRLLSFDMGGTSTDVAMIDGELRLTSEGRIGNYPVAVPMVDMHTIGAGGGSIARVDAGGLLQVGPQSAGAAPGPACYGRGGCQPTVTDANLILGRLQGEAFLGGTMVLDMNAARTAVGTIASGLGVSIEVAAAGIIHVANEHMARALRVISVHRGVDPRDFTLVSFGGAGGQHVCALADALGMPRALVPAHAGVLSALGMLVAPRERQLSRTLATLFVELPQQQIEWQFTLLEEQGRKELEAEGVPAGEIRCQRTMDLRYRGQSYTLNIPWGGPEAVVEEFHEAHRRRYGHRLDAGVELVNVRVAVRGRSPVILLTPGPAAAAPERTAQLYGIDAPVPVMARNTLFPGQEIHGPALITETVATTFLAPRWQARVDPCANLILGTSD